MKKLEQLVAFNKLSKKNPKWIHRNIFRILRKDEIWISAYEKLKSNKGGLTPGSSSVTMDGMSLQRLYRLKEKVLSENYKFNPVKLTSISKLGKKDRSLGLPIANDKIVQEVMRMILEAIYEPVFTKQNFGFRTGLGCHDALKFVEKKFRWVDYVIEGDIEQIYLTIDHHTLVKILGKRIDDARFIRLIWKFLGYGIITDEGLGRSKIGVPQDSILSPIMANIYYHELDEFIQNIAKRTETSKSERKDRKSSTYRNLEYKMEKVSKKIGNYEPQSSERKSLTKDKKLKTIRAERLKTERAKNTGTRIEYVRYADDWMVAISGDKDLVYQIKNQISDFMKDILLQKLHQVKTKITNLRKGNASFLGYQIFLPRNPPISGSKGKEIKTIRKGQRQLRFDIPVAEVTQRFADRGYLKLLPNGNRPISRASYSVLEDHVIVSHFRSLWLGLLNYYSGSTNRGRLQYIHYLLHMSCAMTLAHRHRSSVSKIFRKHGKYLSIKIPNTNETVSFPYKTSWKLSERKWLCGKPVYFPKI